MKHGEKLKNKSSHSSRAFLHLLCNYSSHQLACTDLTGDPYAGWRCDLSCALLATCSYLLGSCGQIVIDALPTVAQQEH
jgi:hypothetical protein